MPVTMPASLKSSESSWPAPKPFCDWKPTAEGPANWVMPSMPWPGLATGSVFGVPKLNVIVCAAASVNVRSTVGGSGLIVFREPSSLKTSDPLPRMSSAPGVPPVSPASTPTL
jgi:hypothetical protein